MFNAPVNGDQEPSSERHELVDGASNLVFSDSGELNARTGHAALELEYIDVAVLWLRLVGVHHCSSCEPLRYA